MVSSTRLRPVSPLAHFTSIDNWGQLVREKLINLDFSHASNRFEGEFSHSEFMDATACRLTGRPHRTTRSIRRLREVDSDFMMLLYLKRGTAVITHDNFDGRVDEGSFFLIDGTKPHELEMENDFEHIALRTSRKRLVGMHQAVTALTGRPLDALSGDGLLASLMLEAALASPGASNFAALTAFEGVIKTLSEHWVISDNCDQSPGIGCQDRLISRMIKTLECNFANPDYSCNELAVDVGISRRYVDKLFAKKGTSFGRFILEKRLQRCHAQLSDRKLDGRQITAIAFENGFSDLSHFSRTFRNRFGCTARTVRQVSVGIV